MSDERPQSERGARSTHEGGTVPGLQPIEVDREIQFRQLVWMGVGLVVTALLSGVVVFFLLRGFLQAEREAEGPPPPMGTAQTSIPGPQLLARPERELARVRQLEAEQIDSYGWVDAQQGIARIPIDRAIDLVAAKGLPSRPSAPASEAVAGGATGSPEAAAQPGATTPAADGQPLPTEPAEPSAAAAEPTAVSGEPTATPAAPATQPTPPGDNR